MPLPAILGGIASSLVGGLFANKAAKTQAKAAASATALQTRVYEETKEGLDKFSQPGERAVGILDHLLTGAEAPEGFDGLEMSESTQFMMDKGFGSVKAAARARGSSGSGSTLMALEDYRRGMATTDRDSQISSLFSLAQMGQNAAAGSASTGANYAANASETMFQGANAKAAGYAGIGNAVTSGINQGFSIYGAMKGLTPGGSVS